MSQQTILVTGAAGGVGSTARVAIAILLEQGHRVRAMVRKLDARADALHELGAEVVVADMLDIMAVRAAMQGCSVVYFTMSVSANYLEAATNVAVTAKSLNVKAFVSLSQMTVSQMSETETTSSPQQKQEWLAEQMLRWSGLPVVYLRPTAFLEMFLIQAAKGIRHDNAIRMPFADGRTSPIAAADVGAAAATVLANPEPHIGKVYDLTGPQSLTMVEVAREFSRALGRTIQYVNVPPPMWEAKLQEARLPAHLTAHLITMGQLNRDNRYDRMTETFQRLVGRAPISAAEFARRHAAAFTPQGESFQQPEIRKETRPKLNWKLLTKKRGSSTQGLPPGKEDLAWVTNTVTLIYGERDAVLVDTFLSVQHSKELIDWIAESGKNLTTIYITHAHGDHFLGLKLLLDSFPNARALATAEAVAGMQQQMSPQSISSFWEPRFPGQIPSQLVAPEVLDGDTLYLEGEELKIVELGHTDTANSTALYVPSISLVVSGDAVYNNTHPYLAESSAQARVEWLSALDKIEDLHPSAVIAGHGVLDPDSAPRHIEETRRYLRDFNAAVASTSTATELYEKMLASYPDRVNPGSLWGGAKAVKQSAPATA